ncbi:DUF5677 domain-containing protein [Flammeovirga sp. EKP202]|uniref:DUF5677 domain-containing protein n=1 Tax=Flammeovirga sp. EKP202 TaxID=2770592 RepID=UPI00165F4059|nr:DUF5677 domain-containing protein [Flammeovirga sp. EKP202]MBD0404122.1 hypothetical protein [Flammeovirga sp. EKP202]
MIERLKYLINKSVYIIDQIALSQSKVSDYDILAFSFLKKNTISCISILNIISPIKSQDNLSYKYSIYDINSSFILIRALFESYVNMFYLLDTNLTEDERELRYLLWKRHAFVERQKISEYKGLKDKKLDLEKNLIEDLNIRIKSNSFFNNFSDKQKSKYLEKEWNWDLLGDFSTKTTNIGINKKRVDYLYKFLSNYSHSQSYAFMQVSELTQEDAKSLINGTPLLYTISFLAKTLELFFQSYSGNVEKFKQDAKLKLEINHWINWLQNI